MVYKFLILIYPRTTGIQIVNGEEKPMNPIDDHQFVRLCSDINKLGSGWTATFAIGTIEDIKDSYDIIMPYFTDIEDVINCFDHINPVDSRKIFLMHEKLMEYVVKYNLPGFLESTFLSYYDSQIETGSDYFPKSPYCLVAKKDVIPILKKVYNLHIDNFENGYSRISIKSIHNNLPLLLTSYFSAYLEKQS